MNIVRDKLIDFAIYNAGNELIGTADVTLPDIEYMTETIKGAGIAGEIDSFTLGMTKSATVTLNWNTVNGDLTELAAPKAHDLDIRGAQQLYNAGSGEVEVQAVKVNIRGLPKKASVGKFEKSTGTGSSNELEVLYMKISIDGVVKVEIDKLNGVHKIGGNDYLSPVRTALGRH